MSFPVAIQVYSVRGDASADLLGTLTKIKEMGYDGVELAGDYGLSAGEIKRVLDELALVPFSAHVPMAEMYEKPDETFSFYREIGVKYIVVPYIAEEYRPDTPAFPKTIRMIREIGENAKKYGMLLLYHNHDFEFVRIDGGYGLDVLYDSVPADLLATELDTCWVKVAGEDPVAYVNKYAGRAPVVHLKDFYRREGASRDGMYELIGIDKKVNETAAFEFRAVGHGMQTFPPIVEAAEKAGAEWVVVEQDRPSQGLSSMECIDISRKYLRSIGL